MSEPCPSNFLLPSFFIHACLCTFNGIIICNVTYHKYVTHLHREVFNSFYDLYLAKQSSFIMELEGIDLSNNVNEGVDAKDRISELPEFIIHHILSFLSTKAVVKTSLLSKRWNGFTSSYPVLDFNEDYFQDKEFPTHGYKPDQKFMPKYEEFQTREKVMHFLNNSLLRFCEQKICMDTLMLKVTLLNKKNTALVNKWVQMAVENRVKVLDVVVTKNKKTLYRLPEIVFSAKRLTVLKLVGCRLEHSNMKNTITLYSLKKLSLGNVYVEEQMLQNLVSCCPSIEHLTLKYCVGLKKFHAHAPLKYLTISSLPKLETVYYIEGSSIRNLIYGYSIGEELGEIKVNACQNLRVLSLTGASITDQCLYDLGTKFPHLQTLNLSHCNMLETVHISSPSLNTLILWVCKKIREGEIDTPNLRNFKVYNYDKFPKLSLKSGGSCQTSAYCLTNSRLDYQYHLNTDWLLELREFLKNAIWAKTLSLDIKGQVCLDKRL